MKKTTTWYGFRRSGYDSKISEGEVRKETPKQITFDDSTANIFRRGTVWKSSSYEVWFPTREEAVAEKLKLLKRGLKVKGEEKKLAQTRLAEFKERENV